MPIQQNTDRCNYLRLQYSRIHMVLGPGRRLLGFAPSTQHYGPTPGPVSNRTIASERMESNQPKQTLLTPFVGIRDSLYFDMSRWARMYWVKDFWNIHPTATRPSSILGTQHRILLGVRGTTATHHSLPSKTIQFLFPKPTTWQTTNHSEEGHTIIDPTSQ